MRSNTILRALVMAAFVWAGAVAAAPATGPFVSRHTGAFGGETVTYVATVSETVLKNGIGQPTIRFVTTSYVREGVDAAQRPVIFAFNGGPSVSSATLHMVALGPKRVVVTQDPTLPAPSPHQLIDNVDTVLDVADLVFVDPAETGFTRALQAAKRESFYSTDGDAASVSEFVTTWIAANGREKSPKYVLGESYGTMRAAVMAGQLASTMPLDGVFLFGQAVNIVETTQRAKNALAYATNLPALAAVAAYHGKADRKGKSMSAFIDEVYAWGMGEYLQALIQARDLPAAKRQRIAERLARLTGISAEYYVAHDLVISKVDFAKELLKDQRSILGQYDARYVGPAPQPGAAPVDPFGKVTAAITPTLVEHMSKTLGVSWPMSDYRSSAPGALDAWNWSASGGIGGPFLDYNYAAHLTKAFEANPRFRLMIGTGIYDLTTTVGPARYLVATSHWPLERVFLRQYEGGHMAYTHEPSLRAFCADIRAFVTGRTP
jgi:carboxypeptidase C (cathepsin A)